MAIDRTGVFVGLGTLAMATALAWASSGSTQVPRNMPQIDPQGSYPCCNVQTGEIIGDLPLVQCASRPGHAPKIPGMPNAENMCTGKEGGGGGGGQMEGPGGNIMTPAPIRDFEDEPVWDEYEENIDNGSFEQWRGSRPVNFGSYRRDESVREFPPELRNYETVFRTSEAYEGSSAIELKNFFLDLSGRLAGAGPIPPQVRQLLQNLALPGGTLTCQDDCPLGATQGGSARELRIPVEDGGNAICGVYRDELKGSDVLMASVSLFSGGNAPIAGATAMDIRSSYRSRDEDGWIKFRLPIERVPGGSSRATEATIQFQIMPSANPAAASFGGLNGPMLDKDSRVVIDAVHFCKVIDLQVTDAESAGGYEVPESEDELGGMAWVNWDNDDADGIFDHEDTDIGGAEDDLAKLVMTLPRTAEGEVVLRTMEGGGTFKFWESETKEAGSLWSRSNQPLDIEEEFTLRDGEWVKELWVEGIEVSEEPGAIKWEFEYRPDSGAPIETDKVNFTVLGLKELSWEGYENSRDDSARLDADPQHPINIASAAGDAAGAPPPDPEADRPVRVFPGKRYVGGAPTADARDELMLRITMAASPPRAVSLFLRSFDVDDPSANDDEVDDETTPYDNRGGFDGGSSGRFTSNDSEMLELRVNRAEHAVDFRVTRQPGDNFRVVGFGDRDFVERLENDDTKLGDRWEDGARIVDPDVLASGASPEDAEVREVNHFVSDTLTVWRFLHVELDSMRAKRDTRMAGTAGTVTRESYVYGANTVNAYKIPLGFNIASRLPLSARGTEGITNMFEGGRYHFGETVWTIMGNSAQDSGNDHVYVFIGDGFWTANGMDPADGAAFISGKSFEIEDDDFTEYSLAGSAAKVGPFPDGTAIRLPPTDRLEDSPQNAFHPAYVFPRTDTLPQGPGSVEFSLNLFSDSPLSHIREYFSQFSMKDEHSDPALWTAYLLGAYQGVMWEDADPASDGAVAGEADGPQGTGGLIYWSSGAELENQHGSSEGWRLIDAVPHELGHLFGGDHGDEGLMSDGVDGHPDPEADFSPVTLDKIRSAPYP